MIADLFLFWNSSDNKWNTGYGNGHAPGFLQAMLNLDQGQGTIWESGPLERAQKKAGKSS